jgi:hypothetical protein
MVRFLIVWSCRENRSRPNGSASEIIAGCRSKAGWSWGCVSAVDSHGRTIWIVDAHRDEKRFIVRADEADGVCGTGIRDSQWEAVGCLGVLFRRVLVSLLRSGKERARQIV